MEDSDPRKNPYVSTSIASRREQLPTVRTSASVVATITVACLAAITGMLVNVAICKMAGRSISIELVYKYIPYLISASLLGEVFDRQATASTVASVIGLQVCIILHVAIVGLAIYWIGFVV